MRRFAFAACVLSAGCRYENIVSASYDLPSGRTVSVSSHSGFPLPPLRSTRLSQTHDTFTAEIGRTKVVVEPTAVMVDGTRIATIPEATKTVALTERKNRLRVTADGAPVYDGDL